MSKRKPRFKECRRLNLNFIDHPKAMKKANSHNSREKRNLSNYGYQLLEKQRLKAYYNVKEKNIRHYVKTAINSHDNFSHALIKRLELRLDNIVYRLGFASSIYQARQLVVHRHILLNDKRVKSPSQKVSPGDIIKLREASQKNPIFKDNFTNHHNTLDYLSRNVEAFEGKLVREPNRNEIPIIIKDHLVTEFYSKVK